MEKFLLYHTFKSKIFSPTILESEPESAVFATAKPTKERAKKSQCILYI